MHSDGRKQDGHYDTCDLQCRQASSFVKIANASSHSQGRSTASHEQIHDATVRQRGSKKKRPKGYKKAGAAMDGDIDDGQYQLKTTK